MERLNEREREREREKVKRKVVRTRMRERGVHVHNVIGERECDITCIERKREGEKGSKGEREREGGDLEKGEKEREVDEGERVLTIPTILK